MESIMGQVPKNVYTVGQLNTYIRNMFSQDYLLNSIYVKGEVSNLKYHSSGHIYFTLKDEKGTIACVMFAGNRSGLGFRMEEGMQIIVGGNVDVYERDGKYQLYARTILLSGNGQLYEKYEQLKQKLEDMGMFAPEYKQPIPRFIRTLGVVTADTGAAVRDIINIATRRNPYIQIILYPAIVQGDGAAPSIVAGIRALESLPVDVMIVGRGGGSIEDLWAFNEEAVAQAVFDCSVPVISAVGHETDTTICDYVADLRAPTPSAAAELAVYDVSLFEAELTGYANELTIHMKRQLEQNRNRAARMVLRLQNLSPMNQLKEKRMYAIRLEEQLQNAMQLKLTDRKHRLALLAGELKGLSPIEKLQQGLSYVSDEKGKQLSDVRDVQVGQNIIIEMKNGEVTAAVTDKKEIRREQEGQDEQRNKK